MILACHQPNFMPYPGFFHKMKSADIFTFSDSVTMSRHAFFNYNYLLINGEKRKVTVPVYGSSTAMLKDIKLCDWQRNGSKLLKTIAQSYAKAQFFDQYMPTLEQLFLRNYDFAVDLNLELIGWICAASEIATPNARESTLIGNSESPNEDILKICKKLGASSYLCGNGAGGYFNQDLFEQNGISVMYDSYKSDGQDFSSVHYLLTKGCLF